MSERLNESAQQTPLELLQSISYQRWLTVLFTQDRLRIEIAAIHLLDQALADVHAAIRATPMMGLLRLQWWRDALRAHAEAKPEARALRNPVLDSIGPFLAAKHWQVSGFDPLIAAHEMLFSEYEEIQAGHAEAYGSALASLLLMTLGITDTTAHQVGASVCADWRRRSLGLVRQMADPASIPVHWSHTGQSKLEQKIRREGLPVWLLRYLPATASHGWYSQALLPLRLWLAALRG